MPSLPGRIPARYPVVEFLTGALFFVYVLRMGPTLAAAKYCLLGALLVGLFFRTWRSAYCRTNLRWAARCGLDVCVLCPGAGHHRARNFLAVDLDRRKEVDLVRGVVVRRLLPAFFLWFGGFIYEKIRKREGMGFGDIKMMLMIGAFLGMRDSF